MKNTFFSRINKVFFIHSFHFHFISKCLNDQQAVWLSGAPESNGHEAPNRTCRNIYFFSFNSVFTLEVVVVVLSSFLLQYRQMKSELPALYRL